VTDRDDALRKEFGPEASDYEPDTGPSAMRPSQPPSEPSEPSPPRRPPVDFAPPADTAQEAQAGRADDATSAGGWHAGEHAGSGPFGHPADPSRRDPERPRGSFRDPFFGAQPTRETRPTPPPGPPPEDRGGQPTWQPQHPGRPPVPPSPPQPPAGPPGPPPWAGPRRRVAPPAPPGSYADAIRVNELVRPRKEPPAAGWRRLVYRATFGLLNPGPSPDEIRQRELEAKIRGLLRGHYKVGVMGKGGVGKTTVAASIGSVFAELRQEDRVVAVDADTAFGKLGSRVDPKAQGSYWELAADQHLESFADVRGRVGNNAAGLFVLAGEASPARRRVLDPAIYREATSRLDRYFSISIVDCSSTMDSPVTQEVLRDLDALIVVSSPWVDGAAAAGQTLDWLANRGLTGLLQRTVVVLNDSDGHADKRTRSILAQQFAGHGQMVVEVPFDGQLRPGGVIDGTRQMSPATRRKFLEVAAALAEHFPTHDDRLRDRG
jgi:MinD-like ATPase involved in chromosome partitioning or flagellar assembly